MKPLIPFHVSHAMPLLVMAVLAGCTAGTPDGASTSPFRGAGSVPLNLKEAAPSTSPAVAIPENVWPTPVTTHPANLQSSGMGENQNLPGELTSPGSPPDNQIRSVTLPLPSYGAMHTSRPIDNKSEVNFVPPKSAQGGGTNPETGNAGSLGNTSSAGSVNPPPSSASQ